jgi:uncharacterized protein YjbJ (UPF0337 family)
MGEARLKGSATKVSGKAKESAGKLTGDQRLKGEGVFDQIKGKIQNAVSGIKNSIGRK